MRAAIDHLVVTAPTLEAGAAYIRAELGVDMVPGGPHPRMGTHNLLLKLGETTYLEVLSVNPEAPPPDRPRWFELDQLTPDTPPRLVAWVARVDDIEAAVAASPVDLGNVEEMQRGGLTWLITVAGDGRLPQSGLAPVLIQWVAGKHPSSRLPDARCTLATLRGGHPTEQVSLPGIDVDPRWFFSSQDPGGLEAAIQAPAGMRTLRTGAGA